MEWLFGKKKKEKVYAGIVGDLSDDQAKVLAGLKEWIVSEDNVLRQDMVELAKLEYDDHDLLRFCRAR